MVGIEILNHQGLPGFLFYPAMTLLNDIIQILDVEYLYQVQLKEPVNQIRASF